MPFRLAALVLLALAVPAAPARAANGFFKSTCAFTHRAPDDPIVHPQEAGHSHSHDFFGNNSTDALSTYESLLGADTRCKRAEDRAAYWVPTLYVNGTEVLGRVAGFYYQTGGKPGSSITPFPAGLKIVAGDAASTRPQDPKIVAWRCNTKTPPAAEPPSTCPRGTKLVLEIGFPDCWNGTDLDSADHKSHMAYSARGACPATHPVPVPRLLFTLGYPLTSGNGITLASGPVTTAHADFFNAWQQGGLVELVHRCINAGVMCDDMPLDSVPPPPPPEVKAFTIRDTRLRVADPNGTVPASTFRFTLSLPAGVVVRIQRNDRRPPARHLATRATLKADGTLGPNLLSFSGVAYHRRLAPGRYRAAITATDKFGQTSAARHVAFRVLR